LFHHPILKAESEDGIKSRNRIILPECQAKAGKHIDHHHRFISWQVAVSEMKAVSYSCFVHFWHVNVKVSI
jgi:hypothetical protein